LFKTFDDNFSGIEKFVIDLRFNEGGNGYLLSPFIKQFILREKLLCDCKLYIITGNHTFSAAPNYIGQMLKNTNAITVGDIAAGPLNWCSDVIDFVLPNSNLRVNISTMYWQEGHATDNRGYYPPDYYMPAAFKDYVSCSDPIMDAIKNDKVVALKDILLNEGAEKFLADFNRKKEIFGNVENWFPYTSFDMILLVYFNLMPEGKTEDALKILNFNTVLYPEDSRAWYALAETYREDGKMKEALAAYKKLISMEPNTFGVNNEYNKLLLLDTYNEKGIKGLAELINELKKNNQHSVTERTLNDFGYQRMRENKIPDAIEIFKLNIEIYPIFANGYSNLGEAYMKIGDKELAKKNFKKSLELDPENSNAKKMLEELNKN
jgi:tetratricopeptide (TPR) repeat protein